MSTTINLPVLLAQLPHLAKVTAVQQESPKTQAEFSEALARQREEKDKSKVQEVEKKQKTDAVNDEHKQQKRQQMRDRRGEEDQEPEEDQPTPAKTPWAGNIINLKI